MTAPVSARIGEIAKRCEAATEGPWTVPSSIGLGGSGIVMAADVRQVASAMMNGFRTPEERDANAAFIAHARDDIPYLLSLVAQYQEAGDANRFETSALNADSVTSMLRDECSNAGGQKSWAERHGVSPQYVNDVLSGRREPGDAILTALGLERVVAYRRAPPPSSRSRGRSR